MPLAIFQQILARPLLWIVLISLDVVGQLETLLKPQGYWVYVIRLALALVAFAYLWLLKNDALITDIREILFFDVLVNCFATVLFVSGLPVIKIYVALSGAVFFLKYGRLVWHCKTADGSNFTSWPVFGVWGFLARRASSFQAATAPTPTQALLAYLLIIGCLLLGTALSLAEIKTQIAYFCVIPLLFAPTLYKRIQAEISALHARYLSAENAKLEAEKAADRFEANAKAQRAIAEEKEQSNQRLAAKNAEIQALLTEREKDKALLDKFNAALRDAAHDLQHPMAIVRIHANVLMEMPESDLLNKEKRQILSQKLDDALDEMGDMIDATVHSAQVVTGIIQPEARVVDMDGLFKKFQSLWFHGPNRQGLVYFFTSPSKHTGLYCPVDLLILKRIMRNLMANAIQHSPYEGGVLVCMRRRGGQCLIQVRDTGPGIAEGFGPDGRANFLAFAQRIRDEGSHVKDGAKRSGYRLGMSNVLQLCMATGLEMQLCAKPGRGSMFSFTLPLATPEQFIETKRLAVAYENEWAEIRALMQARRDVPMPNGQFFPEDDDLAYHGIKPTWPDDIVKSGLDDDTHKNVHVDKKNID